MDVNLSSAKKKLRGVRAFVFALAIAVASGAGFEAVRNTSAQQSQLPSPADLSRTFINVAKQVKPAVVNIDVVEKTKRSAANRLPEGFPQIPGFPPFDNQPRRQRGTGSGVIISADGYILTNNHVAGDAAQINVKLADGREMKARRIGADPETDLAVIKIDAQGLPFARIGNSDSLEQGEWVIALGSPFGLEQTMTAGIVSATGRDLPGSQFTHFIQTDASINPGNSGGPLVNMQGEIVGINTLIFSQSGTSSGVGFAIPSNLANKVYAQIVKGGKVTRGYLGVLLKPVTPAIARSVGFQGTEGVLVDDIAKADSPAAKAGLRSGDVITEFEGKPVKSPAQLTELVADTPVGRPAQLKFVRDGHVQTTTVNLGERPAISENTTPDDGGEGEEENGSALGISIANVTPESARELKLKIASGVIVQSVQPDGPAAEAGLRRGDVIHRINRITITNRQDLVRAMASLKGEKELGIQFERGGQLAFVGVTLE
ncbi:MAG TPA: trypsin-like peptidase domain-containing protein [Blastocatellia bacterium]|jgi:serine protease Do|nr:trypsin-like peptidase domain-containing protein [Blastocatellia bacterium]